jgi:segregation and condensation protein A
LMRIKARMLLPATPEEEEEEEDPREELVRRLLEYKRYKEAAETLKEREDRMRRVFERGFSEITFEDGEAVLEEASLFDLLDALRAALARTAELPPHEVEAERLNIMKRMDEVWEMLRTRGKVRFSELLATCRTRMEIIGTFISLLELIKSGRAGAVQRSVFGDIWIYSFAKAPEVGEVGAE